MSNETKYKKLRKKIRALENFNYNNVKGRRIRSKCDTELYVVSTPYQALIVHEGGHWYRQQSIQRRLRWMIPPSYDSVMQRMGDREMQTLSEFGITGIVMGEHERGLAFEYKLGGYYTTYWPNPWPETSSA